MATTINAGNATTGAAISADTTGIIALQTGSTPTTAVTIDTSQNVGIGTASPARKLDVTGSGSTTCQIERTDGTYVLALKGSGTTSVGALGMATNDMVMLTNGSEQMRITSAGNLLFNSGYGSAATAYGCRAWVNFNGTGTVAIRASGNVTSITDNGTGSYTVNFTTAMPDANYAAFGTTGRAQGGSGIIAFGPEGAVPTTAAWQFSTISSGISATDAATVYVSIFR
jgi:hypothetical protein